MPRIKIRRLRHRFGKFFGFKEDAWARLGGNTGRRGTYGHYSGMTPPNRTRQEIRWADDRNLLKLGDD